MLENHEISNISEHFGLTFQAITNFYDTSHGENDQRFNYILDDRYVLRISSVASMWENRLQEISRLIARYQSIGVYCPSLLPATDGKLSTNWQEFTCFIEEYAPYPVCEMDRDIDRKEVVEHSGIYRCRSNGDKIHVEHH